VQQEDVPGGRRLTYAWDARLPSDPRVLLQVIAASDAQVVEQQTRMIARSLPQQPRRRRMFVFAVGVNQYQDALIPNLDFAVNNASNVVQQLRTRGQAFYDSQIVSLLNDRATRSMWNVVTSQYAEQMRYQVTPDDLLVIYLSGHGVRDEDTEQYYYVPSNARLADIKSQRFGDCLSLQDISAFSEIPCRKLVILDTCHSGAVQPLQQKNLKAALRALQDDMMFTLTASDGNQEAVEESERKLGRFTYHLLTALNGDADLGAQGGNGDNVVTLNEVIQYVKHSVERDSSGDTYRQTPTAGPDDLLPLVHLPLTPRPAGQRDVASAQPEG
jgi:uncharacterized caspase-like protein